MSGWQEMQEPVQRSQEDIEAEIKENQARNAIDIEVEGEEPAKPEAKPRKLVKKESLAEGDSDIEVVDDTPESDRGRGPAAPPPDVTADELEGYSDKVKKRMSHLMRGYHDERRVKEQALRERQAAEEFAQAQLKRAKELEAKLAELQTTAQTATKGQLEAELSQAKKDYREAYDAGDADKLEQANDRVIELRMRLAEASKAQVPVVKEESSLQTETNEVYSKQDVPTQTTVAPDPKAIAWQVSNPWFGQDPLMTQFVQGLHIDLVVNKGVDPRVDPDTYYKTLNKRVRQAFPDYDWAEDELDEQPEPAETRRAEKKPATVVAGASRSTPARKVILTQSQVAIARRLGVSLEEYARQLADLNNGGR